VKELQDFGLSIKFMTQHLTICDLFVSGGDLLVADRDFTKQFIALTDL